jgi:hypothetical protein
MSNRSIHLTTIVENNEITFVLFFGTIRPERAGRRANEHAAYSLPPKLLTWKKNYKFQSDSAVFAALMLSLVMLFQTFRRWLEKAETFFASEVLSTHRRGQIAKSE